VSRSEGGGGKGVVLVLLVCTAVTYFVLMDSLLMQVRATFCQQPSTHTSQHTLPTDTDTGTDTGSRTDTRTDTQAQHTDTQIQQGGGGGHARYSSGLAASDDGTPSIFYFYFLLRFLRGVLLGVGIVLLALVAGAAVHAASSY
jgi:hypothetical protein